MRARWVDLALLSALASLAACAREGPPAPVELVGAGGLSQTAQRENLPRDGYVVQRGDTLFAISRRFDVAPRALIEANGLTPPYGLQIGQRLDIPQERTHMVTAGETLSGIARRYGVDQSSLVRLNRLPPPYLVQTGQRLVLPAPVARTDQPPPIATPRQSVEMAPLPPVVATRPAAQPAPPPAAPVALPPAAPPPVIVPPAAPATSSVSVQPLPPPARTGVEVAPSPPIAPAQPPRPAVDAPLPQVLQAPATTTQSGQGRVAAAPPAPPPPQVPPPAPPSPPTPPAVFAPPPPVADPAPPPPPPPAPVVEAPPPPAAQARAETAAVPPRASRTFLWPVRGRVIGTFGPTGRGQHNDGLNIAAPRGTPVRAAENGVVAHVGDEIRGFGTLILVRHADGFVTAYAHLDAAVVQRGDTVRRGQVIGRVGQTGAVEQPQLHFEVRQGTQAVDPQRFLGSPSQTSWGDGGPTPPTHPQG
ncbi:MAG: peptidoglycan DD-metalloendopeptidase family protein [Alphaproteobacteria bacterium]|nr:peptidoglycan DD-metalloendopeptidase family protein [Alphaproteobacteria bacterium]